MSILKFELYDSNRTVLSGRHETVVGNATVIDKILITLMILEVFGAWILAKIVPLGMAVLISVIAVFATGIIECFYVYRSRFKKMPPKEIWMFVTVDIYLIWILVLFIRESKFIMDALFGIFLIVGVCLVIDGIIVRINEKKCTLAVNAVCIDVEIEQRTTVDADYPQVVEIYRRPIFKFNCNGKERIIKKDYYESGNHCAVGDKVKLYVNPKDLSKFRYEKSNLSGMLSAMGVWFIVCYAIVEFAVYTHK
jgi:hypothetical protein